MAGIVRHLLIALRLDVLDLCYSSSHEALAGAHAKEPFWTQRSAWLRVLVFFKHLLEALARRDRRGWFGPRGRVLFFYFSSNQLTSMRPVAELVPGAVVACADVFSLGHKDRNIDFPLWLAYVAAVPFLPLVMVKWLSAAGYRRDSFKRSFDAYWLAYGFYLVSVWWLWRMRPGVLVVSNDHSVWTRTLAYAAGKLGIKSVYIQHACVTEDFPPLSFDYALLDGRDALDKYAAAGPTRTLVYLVGMPKFDEHALDPNTSKQVGCVGVCLNRHDPVDRVREACQAVSGSLPGVLLRMRPHPGDTRRAQWSALARELGAELSPSSREGPFDFLRTVDVVVAGESSILLEAAMINVVPVYYDFPKEGKDWYGFAANGLTTKLDRAEDLAEHLAELRGAKPDVRRRARRYCTTLGTPFEGRSSRLAADLIRRVVEGGEPDRDRWASLHTGADVRAYVPVLPEEDDGSRNGSGCVEGSVLEAVIVRDVTPAERAPGPKANRR